MKLRSIIEDEMQSPSEEMVYNFERRTGEHIERVANNLKKLHETTDWGIELLERAKIHDDSKYEEIEREPYIWNTEFHRCKNDGTPFEYPPGVEERVKEATLHHITTNPHHPEAHSSPKDMNPIDVVEMVCDWTAMAQELGESNGSAKGWADMNVGTKWDFSDEQIELIYTTIQQLGKHYWNLHEENEYAGLEDADEFATDHEEVVCHVCGVTFVATHWDNDYTCVNCGRTVCRECEMSGPKVLCSTDCKLRYYAVPGIHEAAPGRPIVRSVTWRPAILTVQFPSGEIWEYMVYEDRWVKDLMKRHKRNTGRLVAAVKKLPGVIATKK